MTERNEARGSLPLISDPRDFLSKPFTGLQTGELRSAPDMDFLKWLPTIGRETGLVLQRPNWYIVKASEIGIPSWIMPSLSDILMHIHYDQERVSSISDALPSLRDFFNCSETAKNLIGSSFGITQYWHIEDYEKRRNIESEIVSTHQRFGHEDSTKEYLKFLEDNDARYKIVPWSEINDQKLRTFLSP